MDILKAKEELHSYKELCNELDRYMDKIQQYEHMIQSPNSIIFGEVVPGGVKKTLDKKINELLDLKQEYEKLWAFTKARLMHLEYKLNQLATENPLYANILAYKYIDNESFEAIAIKVGYSYPHVRNGLYYAALEKYANIMQNHAIQ